MIQWFIKEKKKRKNIYRLRSGEETGDHGDSWRSNTIWMIRKLAGWRKDHRIQLQSHFFFGFLVFSVTHRKKKSALFDLVIEFPLPILIARYKRKEKKKKKTKKGKGKGKGKSFVESFNWESGEEERHQNVSFVECKQASEREGFRFKCPPLLFIYTFVIFIYCDTSVKKNFFFNLCFLINAKKFGKMIIICIIWETLIIAIHFSFYHI